MLAIMGSSGSGKSSLLNILASRLQKGSITGKVSFNGDNLRDRSNVAYVAQEDTFYGSLTVYEEIKFSADCRLPKWFSPEEKSERITRIIVELGLENCRSTPIGNKFIRGVPGGERKRTSKAIEILTDPSIIFLDEPTSGLDTTNALRVMQVLIYWQEISARLYALFINRGRIYFNCSIRRSFYQKGCSYIMKKLPKQKIISKLSDTFVRPEITRPTFSSFSLYRYQKRICDKSE